MSKRPWPENAQPTAEQLVEWCRTGMTDDVVPYVERLLEVAFDEDPVLRARRREVEKRLSEWLDMERQESCYGTAAGRSRARWLITKINQCLGGTP